MHGVPFLGTSILYLGKASFCQLEEEVIAAPGEEPALGPAKKGPQRRPCARKVQPPPQLPRQQHAAASSSSSKQQQHQQQGGRRRDTLRCWGVGSKGGLWYHLREVDVEGRELLPKDEQVLHEEEVAVARLAAARCHLSGKEKGQPRASGEGGGGLGG